MFYVFISPEFSLSLCPFTRLFMLCFSVRLSFIKNEEVLTHLKSPAFFPPHNPWHLEGFDHKTKLLDIILLRHISGRYRVTTDIYAFYVLYVFCYKGFIDLHYKLSEFHPFLLAI